MIRTIILSSFFAQLHVIVTIAIFFVIFSEVANKTRNQLIGLIFGFGAAFLVWKYNTWYVIGMFLLVFYFGYSVIKTIVGNVKDFFKL